MNAYNKLFFIFTLLLAMLISSCEEGVALLDEDVPIIKLLSPSSDPLISNGDTLQIQAEISDNDELHQIKAFITRQHSGLLDTVWQLNTHSHTNTYDLYDTYIVEALGGNNRFELVIIASDHNENEGRESLTFNIL